MAASHAGSIPELACIASAPPDYGRFNHRDRFVSRSAARGGDKAARVAEMLEVQQNGAGLAVAGQKVQQVIDINIRAIARGDEVGKTHLALLRPVRIVLETAADCEIKASLPRWIGTGEKLAFSPCHGASSPRLLGPSRRI